MIKRKTPIARSVIVAAIVAATAVVEGMTTGGGAEEASSSSPRNNVRNNHVERIRTRRRRAQDQTTTSPSPPPTTYVVDPSSSEIDDVEVPTRPPLQSSQSQSLLIPQPLCSCSPTSYTFRIDFMGDCASVESLSVDNPAIVDSVCLYSSGGFSPEDGLGISLDLSGSQDSEEDEAEEDEEEDGNDAADGGSGGADGGGAALERPERPPLQEEGEGGESLERPVLPPGLRRAMATTETNHESSPLSSLYRAGVSSQQQQTSSSGHDRSSHRREQQQQQQQQQKEQRLQILRQDNADFAPAIITSVTFVEFDRNIEVINQNSTYFETSLGNGDVISYPSITAKLDPALPLEDQTEFSVEGVMLVLFGTNAAGVGVQNTVILGYNLTECDRAPFENNGDASSSFGWATLEEAGDPATAFCPAVTERPSMGPSVFSPAPSTSPSGTRSHSNAPSTASPTVEATFRTAAITGEPTTARPSARPTAGRPSLSPSTRRPSPSPTPRATKSVKSAKAGKSAKGEHNQEDALTRPSKSSKKQNKPGKGDPYVMFPKSSKMGKGKSSLSFEHHDGQPYDLFPKSAKIGKGKSSAGKSAKGETKESKQTVTSEDSDAAVVITKRAKLFKPGSEKTKSGKGYYENASTKSAKAGEDTTYDAKAHAGKSTKSAKGGGGDGGSEDDGMMQLSRPEVPRPDPTTTTTTNPPIAMPPPEGGGEYTTSSALPDGVAAPAPPPTNEDAAMTTPSPSFRSSVLDQNVLADLTAFPTIRHMVPTAAPAIASLTRPPVATDADATTTASPVGPAIIPDADCVDQIIQGIFAGGDLPDVTSCCATYPTATFCAYQNCYDVETGEIDESKGCACEVLMDNFREFEGMGLVPEGTTDAAGRCCEEGAGTSLSEADECLETIGEEEEELSYPPTSAPAAPAVPVVVASITRPPIPGPSSSDVVAASITRPPIPGPSSSGGLLPLDTVTAAPVVARITRPPIPSGNDDDGRAVLRTRPPTPPSELV